MPATTQSISQPKLLIGEGAEEVRFFNAMLNHLKLGDIRVEEYGGKRKLSRYLQELLVRPSYRDVISIGITRDADADASSAFQSVCGVLTNIGLAAPAATEVFVGDHPKVGIFILPDGRNAGMLEDLCLAAIRSYPDMQCVDEYFKCIHEKANRQPNNLAKARVHAWLASQVEPDRRLGEAAEVGYWPWDSPIFDTLKQFLRALWLQQILI